MSFWCFGSHPFSPEIFSLTAKICSICLESWDRTGGWYDGKGGKPGRLGVAAYQVGGFDFESELLLLKILCEVTISFRVLDYGMK